MNRSCPGHPGDDGWVRERGSDGGGATVKVPMPVQPPVQPAKTELPVGVAVSFTSVRYFGDLWAAPHAHMRKKGNHFTWVEQKLLPHSKSVQ